VVVFTGADLVDCVFCGLVTGFDLIFDILAEPDRIVFVGGTFPVPAEALDLALDFAILIVDFFTVPAVDLDFELALLDLTVVLIFLVGLLLDDFGRPVLFV
jgi:hypothetical protein